MRRTASWLGWWVGLTALWLLLAGTIKRVDLAAAAVAGAVGASAASFLHTRGLLDFPVTFRRLPRVALLPWRVASDFVIVVLALVSSLVRRQPLRGGFAVVPFPDARSPGARAFAVWQESLAPNTIVVDVDRERGEVLRHKLVPARAHEEPA